MTASAGTFGGRPSLGTAAAAWFVLLFLVAPSLVVIPMSFASEDILVFPPRRYSFYLYEKFFFTSDWVATSLLSARIAIVATILALVLGSAAAYGLVRGTFPGRQVVTLFLLSPMFVPLVVVALAFYIYFATLRLQGTELAFILAHTAYVTPYVIVVLMAALRNVDPNLEQAARTMGAGRFYTFRRVTLPLIKPGLISAGLFGFLLSFDELVIGLFLADFDTKTLPVKMWENIIFEVSPVLAAVSTLLTALAFGLSLFVVAAQTRTQNGSKPS
ncbi:ABC transporter permease [Chelatococcus sp. GCM10030263]|uniref:ABC transporter permease n=1 Tax=Chelatococcus sp. GCM10030263 TaxID=3273387 RepID=UPI00360D13C6